MTRTVSTAFMEGWCGVCGTRHFRVRCLGEILATDPERHAWRGAFATPDGKQEVVGVLVARCDRGWRARVLTLPRRLWTVPGTRCTIKFVAETPRGAEREAREYIAEHCARRGYVAGEEAGLFTPVESFPHEQTKHAEGLDASRRRICEVPVHVALGDGPAIEGTVVLASERGLFVATEGLASPGDPIRIQAELDGLSVVLNGAVRTVRNEAQASPSRPRGLGVGLSNAPARYLSYVRRLS